MALPSTRYNFKGGKKEVAEAVGEIGKAIFQQVNVSVESAAKMVVPNVAEMVSEITEDIKSGSLIQFQEALKKIDTLVNKLGVDINQYSKELGDFLKMRQEKSIKSEETVNQLREKNIMAQVNQMGEVEILNKKGYLTCSSCEGHDWMEESFVVVCFGSKESRDAFAEQVVKAKLPQYRVFYQESQTNINLYDPFNDYHEIMDDPTMDETQNWFKIEDKLYFTKTEEEIPEEVIEKEIGFQNGNGYYSLGRHLG